MSNITVDSRVRIGNGKVEYTVFGVTEKGFNLQDDKGRNRYDVPADKLTEIVAPQEEELSLSTHNEVAKSLGDGIFVLFDDNEPVEYKSFDAAAFSVSRNHVSRFATIVKDGAVTVQRKRVA